LFSYPFNLNLAVEDFSVKKGDCVGFIGKNGSGKTTLLKIMALLLEPLKGEISIDGRIIDYNNMLSDRRKISMLLQNTLLLKRSVMENLLYPLKIRGMGIDIKKVFSVLNSLNLNPEVFARRKWFELSGGEAKRVALAQRLIITPEILILDEPTANVDEETEDIMTDLIINLKNNHKTTILIASHDVLWLEGVANRKVFMKKGSIERCE